MLVVSRKENQAVIFPALGISVKIQRIGGKAVSVGVEAPRNVRVLRGELLDQDEALSAACSADLDVKARHQLLNQLNKANLALQLIHKQLSAGLIEDAEESLTIALSNLSDLDRGLSGKKAGFQLPKTQAPQERSKSSRKLALLVEDDPNERALLAAYLRASGYDVDTACDGQEALEYLAQQKPDAVVMDMEMPRIGGRVVVEKIRQDESLSDVKVFVVSGMEQLHMQIPSGDRGVERWFQKPLCPEELVNELVASLN